MENLTIPKMRKGGEDVSIRFQSFAWNQESGHAEGFIEVHDTVSTKVLMERLTELGATCTGIVTFPNRDGDKTAASALNRVKSLSKSDGYVEVVRGECNAKLLKKAEELAEAERAAAELNHEFSEKTAAAIKLSLEETKESMSQVKETVTAMGEKITSAAKYEERLITSDRRLVRTEKIQEQQATRIGGQTYTLNQLNRKNGDMEREIARLNALINQKDQTILKVTHDANILRNKNSALRQQAALVSSENSFKDQLKEVLTEFFGSTHCSETPRTTQMQCDHP